jgi:hypothetical protein
MGCWQGRAAGRLGHAGVRKKENQARPASSQNGFGPWP